MAIFLILDIAPGSSDDAECTGTNYLLLGVGPAIITSPCCSRAACLVLLKDYEELKMKVRILQIRQPGCAADGNLDRYLTGWVFDFMLLFTRRSCVALTSIFGVKPARMLAGKLLLGVDTCFWFQSCC